ncbi:MAG: AI-2E family transporter [Micromonosporaceae bacterium]
MARFGDVRAGLRRMLAAVRDTARQARTPDRLRGDPPDEAAERPSPSRPTPPDSRPEGMPSDPVLDLVPRGLQVAAAWSWRLLVVAAVVLPLLWVIGRYLILFGPVLISLLLAGLLAPALRWVLVLRLNRSLATLVVLVGGLAVVGGILTLVINQVIAGFEDLRESAELGILRIEDWLRGPPLNMSDAQLEDAVEQAQAWLNENTSRLTEAGLSAVTGTVQFLTGFVLVLVVTFFFLRDGQRIWSYLVSLLPEPARAPMAYAGEGAWRTLGGYVRATVLVAFIDAAGIGLGLAILQVPLAVPLAALVFLGAFVPIVGAFVSGGVAVLVALVDTPAPGLLAGGGVIKALMVLGLILLVQQVEGNILQPVIMSRAVRIHPLAVILAVTGGILLAGVLGALVAVPVVAVINTVVRRIRAYHRRAQAQASSGPVPGPTSGPPAPGAPAPGSGAPGPSAPGPSSSGPPAPGPSASGSRTPGPSASGPRTPGPSPSAA